eukprot:TRINITY_DN294_c0_g1_i2.p1 TRINITY_DN294_c0_g1~~TRINITY_DN294_c0_g1_i2.p1  ORF type:complete len:326 (-),score=18.25 TRINITY_DN294_c0_g1_i2:56-1033(-)
MLDLPWDDSTSYDYTDTKKDWPEVAFSCGGYRQSPIILDPNPKNDYRLKRINYYDYDDDYTAYVDYDDSESQMYIYFDNDDGKIPSITGSYFHGDEYDLEAVVIRVGKDKKDGSEHKIGYHGFAGEIQFIHVNRAVNEEDAAITDANAIAILSFFIKKGYHNYGWDYIIHAMDDLSDAGSGPTSSDDVFPLKKLLPKHAYTYHYYQGSMTFPPCLENVNWHVFTDPITLSGAQLKKLQKMLKPDGSLQSPNIRHPQKLKLRKTIAHIEKHKPRPKRNRHHRGYGHGGGYGGGHGHRGGHGHGGGHAHGHGAGHGGGYNNNFYSNW